MIGRSLSHFRITAKLGEGGMGEVYRAEDTRLGREVAIKVLPEAFTADPERLARFEREARVLASLNHPNIAGIHQVEEAEGKQLLVMELVEGEDLSARLARGPVPLDEALAIALQVAEALESAHERSVVHRDLKPANIKVTPDGQAKVLDFGLAKALEGPKGQAGSASLSFSPTLTAGMTAAGVLLGTAAYMSPEQARGHEPDKRADIWAFGVVLWEMLSGARLFAGDSVSDTLAAVLRDDIDPGLLPDGAPVALRALLARCLDRDPKSRLRDIGEARVALSALAGGGASTLVGAPLPSAADGRAKSPSSRLGWIVAGVLGLAAVVFGILALRPRDAEQTVLRAELISPQDGDLYVGDGLALSPDGTLLAFAGIDATGHRALWVRSLETGASRRLEDTEGAMYPFFSPDGRNLAFAARSSLMRVSVAGGPVQSLTAVRDARGGTWGPDGTIVYAPDFRSGLSRIPASGGEPVELTHLDTERGEQAHRFPFFLPDGKRVLFLVQTAEGGSQGDASTIELLDLASGERSVVIAANSSLAYSETGHLLFWRDGSLMVAGFDAAAGKLTGDPVPIAGGVGYTGNEFATFAISQSGLLVYQSGSLQDSFSRLVVMDRSGATLGEPSERDFMPDVKLSHDGTRAAYRGADNSTIWVYSLERRTRTRFTFEDGDHFEPVWSPDDRWIAYVTDRTGRFQLVRKPSSGLGEEEVLFASDDRLDLFDWSADGRYLCLSILDNAADTDRDLGLYDVESGTFEVLVGTPFWDSQGAFSPDGRWLAYVSAESGQFEVFVVQTRGGDGRFQISTNGGLHPQWDPSGSKVYYVNPLLELTEVELDLGEGVEIGLPQRLFDIRQRYDEVRPFEVLPDREGFLTVQLDQMLRGGHLALVRNWPAEIVAD